MIMDTLGSRIKQRRDTLGLTLLDIARAVGVSEATVQRYESGDIKNPKQPRIAALAKALKVDVNYLMGWDNDSPLPANALLVGALHNIPVLGAVKGGYGGIAYEELEGYELADVKNPQEYFYLRVSGDSMEPQIVDGDLALVRKQDDVESGDIAVVIVNDEEGTIKRLIKKGRSIVLQAFNPTCPVTVLTGSDLDGFYIAGKVVKTVRNW